MKQFDFVERFPKREEDEFAEDEWPFFHFSHHPDALLPVAFRPEDGELQVPFIPLNYGLAAAGHVLATRSRLRRWYRNNTVDQELRIENQLDSTIHVFYGLYYPFTEENGYDLAMLAFQHTVNDDDMEEMEENSTQQATTEWEVALKGICSEDSEDSEDSEAGSFAKDLINISKKLRKHLSPAVMRRFQSMYGETARFRLFASAAFFNDHDAFFDGLVDEYHFARLRYLQGYAPPFIIVSEMALAYHMTREQESDPLVREYNQVISELLAYGNDLFSLENDLRYGNRFTMVAFMRAFYGIDWKGGMVRSQMFYLTLIDKLEDLMAKIYASEWGKDVALICFLEQRKFEVIGNCLSHTWVMRYNGHHVPSKPYHALVREIFPDVRANYCSNEADVRDFNQTATAYFANVSDPFEETEILASDAGFKKHFNKYSWENTAFSEDMWLAKEEKMQLSGPFAGYDPTQPDKNTLAEMTARFAKVYKWSGEERGWSWQRRCLHRYCEKKYGSADWLTRWQTGWMGDYLKPFYQG